MPGLSATQRAVLNRASSHGSSSSDVARGRTGLLSLLGDAATKRYLRQFDDGSRLYELQPDVLLEKLGAEMDAAELVHNFGGNEDKPYCGLDFSIDAGPSAE
eukprot:1642843-Prymnesium_polylepis.1